MSEMDNSRREELYTEAISLCRGSANEENILKAQQILEEIGDYRDAAIYLEKC